MVRQHGKDFGHERHAGSIVNDQAVPIASDIPFLTTGDLARLGIDWSETVDIITEAIHCMAARDFVQPVKPYLRYRDLRNRIIAMPAFLGGNFNMAGIKWISSFPDNIKRGKPRAHCVIILNDADTGEPIVVFNSGLLSMIRTAAVSGLMIKHFIRAKEADHLKKADNLRIGMTGFGPIGQYHLKMCRDLLGMQVSRITIFDTRPIDRTGLEEGPGEIHLAGSWEEAYLDADIFMACTVAERPYIDKPPKAGSLHLNVSLRDYKTGVFDWFRQSIIVDDWAEVCREKTDIEMMHLEKGLSETMTSSIIDVVERDILSSYRPESPVLFNPMGMAVFDIAVATYYYRRWLKSME